jgi:hypothetical protein
MLVDSCHAERMADKFMSYPKIKNVR